MPLTISEILAKSPAAISLLMKVVAGVEALPKPPAPLSAKAVGDLAADVLPDLGQLIDDLRAEAAD